MNVEKLEKMGREIAEIIYLGEYEEFADIDPLLLSLAFIRSSEKLSHAALTKIAEQYTYQNYEAFEFLGDRIIEVIVSVLLMELNQYFTSGSLTRIKSMLVKNSTMYCLMERYQLCNYIIGSKTPAVCADVMEAIVGVLFYHLYYVKGMFYASLDVLTIYLKRHWFLSENLQSIIDTGSILGCDDESFSHSRSANEKGHRNRFFRDQIVNVVDNFNSKKISRKALNDSIIDIVDRIVRDCNIVRVVDEEKKEESNKLADTFALLPPDVTNWEELQEWRERETSKYDKFMDEIGKHTSFMGRLIAATTKPQWDPVSDLNELYHSLGWKFPSITYDGRTKTFKVTAKVYPKRIDTILERRIDHNGNIRDDAFAGRKKQIKQEVAAEVLAMFPPKGTKEFKEIANYGLVIHP